MAALIRRNDPFNRGLRSPFQELESLFDEALSGTPTQPGLTTPVSDVYLDESEENIKIEAHLPGYTENDVEVEVDDGALTIRAERSEKDQDEQRGRKYIVRESSSSYYRRIGLPQNVEEDKINAEFTDGILRVNVPMQELPKPKKVNIEKGKSKESGKKVDSKSK